MSSGPLRPLSPVPLPPGIGGGGPNHPSHQPYDSRVVPPLPPAQSAQIPPSPLGVSRTPRSVEQQQHYDHSYLQQQYLQQQYLQQQQQQQLQHKDHQQQFYHHQQHNLFQQPQHLQHQYPQQEQARNHHQQNPFYQQQQPVPIQQPHQAVPIQQQQPVPIQQPQQAVPIQQLQQSVPIQQKQQFVPNQQDAVPNQQQQAMSIHQQEAVPNKQPQSLSSSLKVSISAMPTTEKRVTYGDNSGSRRAKAPSSAPPPPLSSPPPPSWPLHNKKRRLENGEDPYPKRTKAVRFIPLSEFFDIYPATKTYKFKAGSEGGNIPPDKTIYLTSEEGKLCADGFVQELRSAHKKGRSWGGVFDLADMFVSLDGPLCVEISKQPKEEATDSNVDADLLNLVNVLLVRYGDEGNRPSYFTDLITRIKALPHGKKEEREVDLWVIENHPAFIDSVKRRTFLEDFYKFYKSEDRTTRHSFIQKINLKTYKRWHLGIVRKDNFLCRFYWLGKERQKPPDYHTRKLGKILKKDEDNKIYPFTSEDSYLAVFLRHFIVHGPEAAILTWLLKNVSIEEQELIIAYYFGRFLPNFLKEIYMFRFERALLEEMIKVYSARRFVAWRSFSS